MSAIGIGNAMAALVLVLSACSTSPGPDGAAEPSGTGEPSAPDRPHRPEPSPSPGVADRDLVEAFTAFALEPSLRTARSVPFSHTIRLGLGPRLLRRVPADEAHVAGRWRIEADLFRAHVGELSALTHLRRQVRRAGRPDRSLRASLGEHPHCVGPPVPAPAEVADLRRVSVQPTNRSIGSCLEWFTVDLYVDDHGAIAAVTLDVWEP